MSELRFLFSLLKIQPKEMLYWGGGSNTRANAPITRAVRISDLITAQYPGSIGVPQTKFSRTFPNVPKTSMIREIMTKPVVGFQ